jgi:hypothetical protein
MAEEREVISQKDNVSGEDKPIKSVTMALIHIILSLHLERINMTVHASHPDIIKRLKRAAGHLKSTIQMLEDEKHVWISPSNCTLWKRR